MTTPAPTFSLRTTYPRSSRERPITQAQAAEFVAAVQARMAGQLVPADSLGGHVWLVPTAYGWLRVSLHDDTGSRIFSVFTRFEGTPEQIKTAAREVSDNINHHSGKWNVHCSDAAAAYAAFERQLELVHARPGTVTLATLSLEEYCAVGGPGVAQKIEEYRTHLNALRVRGEAGDLQAKRDYTANNADDSTLSRVRWAYCRGQINEAMRADMMHDWRAHVAAARAKGEPVHASAVSSIVGEGNEIPLQ